MELLTCPTCVWMPFTGHSVTRRDTKTGEAPRHWRWRGALVDYYTAEAAQLGESR